MGLNDYRKKRNFAKTPEPSGAPEADPTEAVKKARFEAQTKRATRQSGARTTSEIGARSDVPKAEIRGPVFVVQKHAASSLHYDLRLRVGDVLKSWAVPKGPSLDPREKRLAVETEDHPLEYATFEGVIPAGEYGGGTMMVWDSGEWAPESDARAALKEGLLKFRLDGKRLRGRWMLVRLKGEEKQWLLVKERDAEANPAIGAETFATSVATGRTMDEIAAGAPARSSAGATGAALRPASLTGAKAASMPSKLKPQLALAADVIPAGGDWLHEVKFDGYRLLFFRKGDTVKAISRSGLDWTSKVPDLASAVRDRLTTDAILDGEAVILDTRGVSDFQALQNAIHNRRSKSIVYFAFDLPWCDGFDLTKSPLEQRRALLRELVGSRQDGRLRFSDHVQGNGPRMLESVRAHGLEGVVSKRLGSVYTQARSPSWLKVKCFNQQEFVVAGYSAPEGTREELGALLLGYYDEKGDLRFCGKVGTGFSAETLKKLGAVLRERIQPKPAFVDPPTGAEARGVTWIRPELVTQVQFRDWSNEGIIRHNSFRGLREDRDPKSVVREVASKVVDESVEKPQRHRGTEKTEGTGQEQNDGSPGLGQEPEPAGSSKKQGAPSRKASTKAAKTKSRRARVAAGETDATKAATSAAVSSTSSSRSDSSLSLRASVVNSPPAESTSSVRLTNPDRVVFPDRGAGYTLTKRQLAEYYEVVAPLMLPHVANRPLAIQRCPDGEGSKAFFQKHPAPGMPAAIRGVDILSSEGVSEPHLLITDAAGLVGLVQMNALEIHPWGAKAEDPDKPDRLIFDLDPGEGVSWRTVVDAAVMVRDALKQVKLTGFVRTTGGKGLHVVIPIKPVHTWDAAHAFSRAVAETLVKIAPRRFVATSIKEQRAGRVYIDYLRNLRGATAVGPYSTRARPGGPVALPIGWDELSGVVSPAAFNVYSVLARVKAGSPDPWAGIDAAAGVLA